MIKKPYNAADKRMEYITNAFAILVITFFCIQIVEGYRWEYSVELTEEGYQWINEERYDSFSTLLNILSTIMVIDSSLLALFIFHHGMFIRSSEDV